MMLLAVEGVSRRFGAAWAVRDVSFTVAAGEVFGLLGANGAGKTTLVDCILGLAVPDSGRVTIGGAMAGSLRAKTVTGALLQATGLPARITPYEALAVFGAFYPAPLSPDALLARFGLREKANAARETLSGGQKQRLALALAFVGDPRLLVLDEPGAGLDVAARQTLHADIAIARQESRAVLLTTHDMAEARSVCDRVAVMEKGVIIAMGAPRDLPLEDLLTAAA